jgi:hypothetical protein
MGLAHRWGCLLLLAFSHAMGNDVKVVSISIWAPYICAHCALMRSHDLPCMQEQKEEYELTTLILLERPHAPSFFFHMEEVL